MKIELGPWHFEDLAVPECWRVKTGSKTVQKNQVQSPLGILQDVVLLAGSDTAVPVAAQTVSVEEFTEGFDGGSFEIGFDDYDKE